MENEVDLKINVRYPTKCIMSPLPGLALLHKDRKYGNNKRVAQETYSKGRDE